MKNIKQLSLLALLVGLVVPNGTFASGNEDEKNQPTVPQKVGREAARVLGQTEDAGKKVAKGWDAQRKKDKEKQKAEKAQRKAEKNK